MNKISRLLVCGSFFAATAAFAAEGSVKISSPADGAVISSTAPTSLSYSAIPGPDGDHLHVNVDGKRVDVLRQLQGTTQIGPFPPGPHQVCLAVNTRGHVPTGVEGCINVTSK